MKKRILCIGLVGLLTAGLLLSGCGDKTEKVDKDSTDQKATEKKVEKQDPDALLKTIGVKKEGENVYQIKLKNETGKDITGFSIRELSQEETSENLLEEDDVFADGEERILYYDATEAIKAAQSEAPADETAPALDPAYDITLTFKDADEEDAVLVLHAFPFDDMESGSIQLEDNVAFVSYHSTVTDQDISTKEAERKIKADEAEGIQQASGQDTAAGSSQAAPQPSQSSGQTTYTPPVVEQPTVEQPPVAEQPSVEQPAGNDDGGCIGDEGLVY